MLEIKDLGSEKANIELLFPAPSFILSCNLRNTTIGWIVLWYYGAVVSFLLELGQSNSDPTSSVTVKVYVP